MPVLMILTVITSGIGMAIIGAGISLIVQTTRSPVASFIWRMAGGVSLDVEEGEGAGQGDFHDRIADLFERHSQMHKGGGGVTIESYRSSLKKAGGAAALLGLALLGFMAYFFMIALPYLG